MSGCPPTNAKSPCPRMARSRWTSCWASKICRNTNHHVACAYQAECELPHQSTGAADRGHGVDRGGFHVAGEPANQGTNSKKCQPTAKIHRGDVEDHPAKPRKRPAPPLP